MNETAKKVVEMRDGKPSMTFSEIGEKLGFTRQNAHKLYKDAKGKGYVSSKALRHAMKKVIQRDEEMQKVIRDLKDKGMI